MILSKLLKNKTNLAFLIILLLQVTMLFNFGNRKEGFHNDEIYSYGLSNSYFKPFTEDCEQWLTSNYFNEYITVENNHKFSYDSVFYNQSQDVHPPLYYLILNTVCSFFPNTFSKWFGIGINILFFILTQIVLLKFSKKILQSNFKALIVCFLWGSSIGAISSVIFIRMYMMLTFLFVLMDYVILNILTTEKISSYQLFSISTVIFLGIFTQYYFVIFAFFTISILSIHFLLNRKFLEVIKLAISCLASIVLEIICFPSCIQHILSSDRGVESHSNLKNSHLLHNLFSYIGIVNKSLFGGTFIGIIIFFVLISIIILKHKQFKNHTTRINNKLNICVFIIPSLLYLVLISQISPYQTNRYIFSIFPFLVLGFCILLYYTISLLNNKKIFKTLVCCFSIFICTCGLVFQNVDYLFTGYSNVLKASEKYKDKNCLYFSYNGRNSSECFMDLKNYNKVYMHTQEPRSIDISTFSELSDLVVYIDDRIDSQDILKYILSNSNMTNYTQMFKSSIFSCYYLY